MRTALKYIFTIGIILIGFAIHAHAQVQYNGCIVTGNYASAIGKNNNASGNNSLAGGYNSQATGSNSLAFGYNSKANQSTTIALGNTAIASANGSLAIGNYVKATAQNSFVFGSGTAASSPLTNSTDNSIAFGINSNKPTLLISKSLNNNYTGKVGIGQVSNPQAKLHIRSDNNENAGVFIEPSNTDSYNAFIKLFDNNHSITVDKTAAMAINAGTGALNFKGESYCFGASGEKTARIYTSGTPSLYLNVTRVGNTETRDGEGTSFAIDFDDQALTFRSAAYQNPRGSDITNWKNTLFLCTDGKIGIGTKNTYLENSSDNLRISSPHAMELQSGNITITGNVGINTINNVSGYALAVDGGIISTKVFIKEVKQWPDHVFTDSYELMDLDDLRHFLSETHHLPGVPSQEEILNSGYDLNEMQTVMMEKIEELTLYLLLLQDEINELKSNGIPSGDSITFTYDANGNRIARSLVIERVGVPLETSQLSQALPYELFPNPTTSSFSILLKESSPHASWHAQLLTITGIVLDERDIETSPATFDLSRHPEGIYLLQIDGPKGHQTWKVIKR